MSRAHDHARSAGTTSGWSCSTRRGCPPRRSSAPARAGRRWRDAIRTPGRARRARHRRGRRLRRGARRAAEPARPTATRCSPTSTRASRGSPPRAPPRSTSSGRSTACGAPPSARARSAGRPRSRTRLLEEAQAILDEDIAANRAMGAHGAALVPAGRAHPHALQRRRAGHRGLRHRARRDPRRPRAGQGSRCVWVDETRPVMQGSRLTAWELAQEGIPHRLIADVAAGLGDAARAGRPGRDRRRSHRRQRRHRQQDRHLRAWRCWRATTACRSTWPRRSRRSIPRIAERRRRSRSRSATRAEVRGVAGTPDRARGLAGLQPRLRRHAGRADHRDHHRARRLPAALPVRVSPLPGPRAAPAVGARPA